MIELSGEFWAAIAGAVVGGVITAGLQLISTRASTTERKRTELLRQQNLAKTLLFKVLKIESDFAVFARHVDECAMRARRDGREFGWETFIPLANFPRPILFAPDEMGALIGTGDDTLFNDVISMDEVHAGALEALQLYRTRRLELSDILPARVTGTRGITELNEQELQSVAPRMAQLQQLALEIANYVQSPAATPFAISRRVVAAMNSAYSMQLRIEDKPLQLAASDAS